MNKIFFILIFSALSLASGQENLEEAQTEAEQLIKKFSKELKTELVKAMQNGGPVNAINVCNIKALEIATAFSDSSSWQITRTSLKCRNDNNLPSEYEAKILKQFEEQLKNGAKFNDLVSITETENEIIYLKAIETGNLCLKCHGDNLSEELKEELVKLYPNDKAIGFKSGEIRGAFSLIKQK